MANATTDRNFHRILETNKRRRGSQQTPLGTSKPAAHGFLTTRHFPKYKVQPEGSPEERERDFFISLAHLIDRYHLKPVDVGGLAYPHNIHKAYALVNHQLMPITGRKLRIVESGHRTYLAEEHFYPMQNMLYYIPVLPLFSLCRKPEKKALSELLLSIFCYLYHCAKVPHYGEASFLGNYYDLIEEWICDDYYGDESDEDQSERNWQLNQIRAAKGYGDVILRKMRNKIHLQNFRHRIGAFVPADALESEVLDIAITALGLLQKYPDRQFDQNFTCLQSEENDVMRADAYVSFFATGEGWISERLDNLVNDELNEYSETDLPHCIVLFDGHPPPQQMFPFESLLFPMIKNLCYVLNNF